jgi:hypothetical protein
MELWNRGEGARKEGQCQQTWNGGGANKRPRVLTHPCQQRARRAEACREQRGGRARELKPHVYEMVGPGNN